MTKYVIISLLLHLSLLIPVILNKLSEEKVQPKAEIQEEKQLEIEVIELSPGIDNTRQIDDRKFYWGLGVETFDSFDEVPGRTSLQRINQITNVFKGYCAELFNIEVGDKILLIDGQHIDSNNEIRGDNSRKMSLTILKKDGKTIELTIQRCKVYY